MMAAARGTDPIASYAKAEIFVTEGHVLAIGGENRATDWALLDAGQVVLDRAHDAYNAFIT
ncbi:MAG TPA: hypothetical protein VF778_01820 [Xanthobacteraceae bacterium]